MHGCHTFECYEEVIDMDELETPSRSIKRIGNELEERIGVLQEKMC